MGEVEDRVAERRAKQAELCDRLAALEYDGPYAFPSGDSIFGPGGMFAPKGRDCFAVCLRCGAMVVLNDPMDTADGRQIERSIRLHQEWHDMGRAVVSGE